MRASTQKLLTSWAARQYIAAQKGQWWSQIVAKYSAITDRAQYLSSDTTKEGSKIAPVTHPGKIKWLPFEFWEIANFDRRGKIELALDLLQSQIDVTIELIAQGNSNVLRNLLSCVGNGIHALGLFIQNTAYALQNALTAILSILGNFTSTLVNSLDNQFYLESNVLPPQPPLRTCPQIQINGPSPIA